MYEGDEHRMRRLVSRVGRKVLPWLQYRHFWNLTIAITTFCIVCILLLIAISYALFVQVIDGEYNRLGEIEVTRINENFNSVVEEISILSNQLLTNNNVQACLFKDEIDYLARYHAYRAMKSSLAINRYLSNISLINAGIGSSLNLNTVSDEDIHEILRINAGAGTGFMRIFTYPVENQQGASDQLLFSINPMNSPLAKSQSTIVLWVDVNRIFNQMLHMSDMDSAIALYNGTTVFAHSNALNRLNKDDLQQLIRQRLPADPADGPIWLSLYGNQYLTFSMPVGMFNWQLIYLYRTDRMPARARLVLLIGLIGIALLGMAVLAAIMYVRHIYQPIGQLMEHVPEKFKAGSERTDEFAALFMYYEEMTNQNSGLSESMQSVQDFVRRSYFTQLLEASNRGDAKAAPISAMLGDQLRFPQYAVAIFDVWACDENVFANRPILPQTVMIGEIESSIPCKNRVELLVREDDRLILVAGLDEALNYAELIRRLEVISAQHASGSQLEISICVGQPANGHTSIGQSYQQAVEQTANRFLMGNHGVLWQQNGYAARPDEPVLQQFALQFLTEIKTASLQRIRGALGELCALLTGCKHADAVDAMQHVMRIVIDKLDKSMPADQKEKISAYIRRIPDERYIGDAVEHLSFLFYDFANAISNRALIKQYALVEQAKQYINQHYGDCNLQIDDLAEQMEISASSLGGLFKYITGIPFYKYVNDMRLKHAEQMLLSTDTPIIEISHNVGIINYTYFFTMFKKKHGVSPKIYRSNKVS